jgi:hypothetical protein
MKKRLGDIRKISGIRLKAVRTFSPFRAIFSMPIVTVHAFEEATVGGQVPPRALIRLAMVHLAIYDAVNAIEGAPFEGYASIPPEHAA